MDVSRVNDGQEHYTREPASGGGWTQTFAEGGVNEPIIDAKTFTTEEV